MRAAYVLALLVGVACGAGAEFVGKVVSLEGLDTSAKVVRRLGPPCFTEGRSGGLEAWHYCAEACAPPREAEWCAASCERPCPGREWVFSIASGLVVQVDGPYTGPTGVSP